MFGLFNKEIGNRELFELIFAVLVNLRVATKKDDRKFYSELIDFQKLMKLSCYYAKKKMSFAQQNYVLMVGFGCQLEIEKLRNIVDQVLSITDIANNSELMPTQIARLNSLKDEMDSIFRTHGANWNFIGLSGKEMIDYLTRDKLDKPTLPASLLRRGGSVQPEAPQPSVKPTTVASPRPERTLSQLIRAANSSKPEVIKQEESIEQEEAIKLRKSIRKLNKTIKKEEARKQEKALRKEEALRQEEEALRQEEEALRQEEARKIEAQFHDPVMIAIPGKNYEIGKYQVTQAEWEAVMGNHTWFGSGMPMVYVSWNDIQEYLTKLNQKTGKLYRLPTEAEWEYACYGGSKTKYSGSNDIDAVAWYNDNSGGRTHPVGQKQANGYGLYDMSGNVWEWMEDCWEGDCSERVRRGGSAIDIQQVACAAYRSRSDTTHKGNVIGFRLARTLP